MSLASFQVDEKTSRLEHEQKLSSQTIHDLEQQLHSIAVGYEQAAGGSGGAAGPGLTVCRTPPHLSSSTHIRIMCTPSRTAPRCTAPRRAAPHRMARSPQAEHASETLRQENTELTTSLASPASRPDRRRDRRRGPARQELLQGYTDHGSMPQWHLKSMQSRIANIIARSHIDLPQGLSQGIQVCLTRNSAPTAGRTAASQTAGQTGQATLP